MTREYLEQLNPQQREAVEYCDGPQLVIAGAGSGKTRVLTYKIVHLLTQGYEPWRIMALTFTNKAAREMRDRIEALVGHDTARRLWMGTFHSIFSRILRQNAALIGFKPTFTIYDSADSKALIKQIIKDMNLDEKLYKPSTIQGVISMAKNALISPDAYAADPDLTAADRAARRPLTVDIYRTYRARCRVAGAMDFDDLLYYTNVLLKEHREVLAHYREFFRYVLVDEYQDTNFAQHCIVTELCEKTNALTMVGDDAQSIYSFRGANIRNILNLRKAYPALRIFKLEQNYRSTQNIVDAANSLIDKNREQIRKQVFSKNDVGPKIEVIQCYTDFEEAGAIADRIGRRKVEAGDTWDDFAILYRTNVQSRRLEEALRKRNIPYRVYGGQSFYQREEVKDALSYFRLAINPDDDMALKRVINKPARGIGDTTKNKLSIAAIETNTSVWWVLNNLDKCDIKLSSRTISKLTAFTDLIWSFIHADKNGANAAELANMIISRTALLSSLLTDRTPENMSRQENLQEVLTTVHEFVEDNLEEGNDNIKMTDFLGDVLLATDQDDKNKEDQGPIVTLMTAHASKGLEFKNVIISGVEDDLFPSAMAQGSAAEIEEERRLLYVAITRAKRFCMMSYTSSRQRNGQTVACRPSPFLRDINPKYLKLMQGTAMTFDRSAERLDRYRESFHSSVGVHSVIDPVAARPQMPPRPRVTVGASARNVTADTAPVGSGDFSRHTVGELADSMEILHERFGRGRIISIEDDPTGAKINVLFSGADQKKLMLKFARFKILD